MTLFLAGLFLLSQPAPTYEVVDLGTLPGASMSSATGIDNKGQIVGESGDGSYESDKPVLWDKAGIHDLSKRGLPGTAKAIDDKGRIVGAVGEPDHPRAYLWTASRATLLAGLAGEASRAYGINVKGEIVGVVGRITGGAVWGHVFLWRHGEETALPVRPENLGAEPCGIDGRGEVVGVKGYGQGDDSLYAHRRPFFWKNGKLRLGKRDDSLGSICGINAKGDMVGCADFGQVESDGSTQYHAFIEHGSAKSDLNRRIPAKSGWVLLEASGINDKGEIVGFGRHRGLNRAFLLRPSRRAPRRSASG